MYSVQSTVDIYLDYDYIKISTSAIVFAFVQLFKRRRFSITRLAKALCFLLFLGFPGYAFCEDKKAGEARYKETCINCHGPAGKGVASYPKISGNEISYTKSKLEAYRDEVKQGPNSALMFMFAEPLTDKEIANLAAYLKDAKYNNN